ncbi:MAG: CotH kinase family protein, partial [Cyclobacteriaceae bacterium]
SILGMPEDKKWILLANYTDKTMLRNEVAFELGRFSELDWTPESRFVELNINDEYAGVYQLTQKVEESDNRVDIGKEGYLIEVDQLDRLDPDDVYFTTESYLFNIKEPSLDREDDEYTLIEDYIAATEKALLGDDFTDPAEGYADYIDVESFIDWYLVNEITKNNDAIFYSSVYMNYIPGGKLKMGPIWDFDISLGNINYNGNETTDGFWVKNSIWYTRLFEDPNFVEKVKSRYKEFYDNREQVMASIEDHAWNLNDAQERNFEAWPILGTYVWPNHVYFDTYDEEKTYLKEWLNDRYEWLNEAINKL